jgi:hypothetical protein
LFSVCKKEQSSIPNSDANLRKHIAVTHKMREYGYDSQLKSVDNPTPIDKTHRKALDKDILHAIIVDSRPFGDFNKPGISKVLKELANGYKPRNRRYNSNRLRSTFKDQREKLKKIFSHIDHVALTSDLWKNKPLEHFIVLTAHFFDKKFNLQSLNIDFEKFNGRHFGKNIKSYLLRQLNKFGILDKIVAITTDNGADIKKATTNGFGTRISCFAHNMSLTAKSVISFKKE